MKIRILLAVAALLLLFNSGANAQAPVISYNPATFIFDKGTTITATITPINTGGTAGITYTVSPALPAGIVISSTTGVISGTPTATSSLTVYTITATNISGSSHASITITVGTTYDWTGGLLSTQWANSNNWSPSGIPGANDNARIGVVTILSLTLPTISSSTPVGSLTFGNNLAGLLANNLTISSGVLLTVNSNLTVDAGCSSAIISSGAVNMAPGSIVNVGTGGILAIGSSISFTLKSTAAGDAAIGQLTSSSQISGSVNVERYMRPLRGYSFLSTPVYNNAPATGNVANTYNVNYLLLATPLTGTLGTTGGFTKPGNPSIYLFNETKSPLYTLFTNSSFRGINDISQKPKYFFDIDGGPFYIPAATGFLFFFRGANPGSFVPNSAATTATLTATGTLNIGPVKFTDWFTPASSTLSYTSTSPTNTAGFNLVGNPYASAINLDTFQSSSTTSGIYGSAGVSNTFYVFDPLTQNYGSYIAAAGFNGVGNAAFVSNIISSGQGFFVKTNATGSTLIFNESAKTTALNLGTQILMGTPVNTAQVQYIRLKMGQSDVVNEQTLIHFSSQASFNYDPKIDAAHKSGNGEVVLLSRSADNIALCINSIPLPHLQSDVVRLGIGAASDGQYSLTMTDMVDIPQLYDIWLMDAYKKDSLDIRHNPTYLFDIYHSDTTSFGANRFKLVIRQNPGYAYHLLNFTANKVPNVTQVQLVWETENEANYTDFAVERSTDGGNTFTILGSMASSDQATYSLLDKNPVIGQNLYRLKQEDINSVITYSKVISVQYYATGDLAKSGISVYPNPSTGIINLAVVVPVTLPSVYNIKFMTSSGQVVKEVSSGEATWHGNVGDLTPGTYIIQVTNSKTPSFVGENKFVKL